MTTARPLEAQRAGFYERFERQTSGQFTHAEIALENPRSMTHLLQRVPGLTVAKGRAGATGVRMRGCTCWPLVWLDVFPMPAGEVDPAQLRIEYPLPLFAAALSGLVIAEYVVHTPGFVEEKTFSIVSSTHPLFSEAVRTTLPRTGYVPARRNGHRVRQLVH